MLLPKYPALLLAFYRTIDALSTLGVALPCELPIVFRNHEHCIKCDLFRQSGAFAV
jgi:hypothetical protein